MTINLLRRLLIITSIMIVPTVGLASLVSVNAPYYEYVYGDSAPIVILQSVSGFFSPVPTAVICLWAAHNLRAVKFFTDKKLMVLCSLGLFAAFCAPILTLIESYLARGIYADNIGMIVSTFAYSTGTWFFMFADIGLLLFAKYQLSTKAAGKNLTSNPYEETFS